MQSRYFQPALIGGLVVGVLSALPLISAGNLCCCLWVILGGATAAYLLQQNDPGPITPGDGALVGLIAGGIGAFVYLLLSVPISIIVTPMERALLERISEASGNVPPELRGYMSGAAGASIRLLIGFLFMLIAGPAFATIGGLIGAALFRKPLPPPASGPIDVTGAPPAQG